jgi:hypothetical protein
MNEILICIAVSIIAVCEVIRAAQNFAQITMLKHDADKRDDAYAELVKSLKMSDMGYVRTLLEKFKEAKDGIH